MIAIRDGGNSSARMAHDPVALREDDNIVGIIAWIVLGAIAGIVAEKLTGSRTGLVMATIVGIVGALLGGFLAKALFHVKTLNNFFSLSTWVTAIVGAVVLITVMHLVTGKRGRKGHII